MSAGKKAMPKTGKNNLTMKIKELIAKLCLIQEQSAAKVGVTCSTVHRWESGKSWGLRQIEELMEHTGEST